MAAATNGGNPMVLGALLIVGAMLYSRQRTAVAANPVVRPGQVGSMPGSAGTGTQQIVGGVVNSLLGYLTSSNGPKNWSIWNPINPDDGTSYNPANPGAPVGVQDLVNGTIHDYYTGDTSSYSIPTTTDIFESVTGGGLDSIIKVPGAYW
jgi:hypothetical protein